MIITLSNRYWINLSRLCQVLLCPLGFPHISSFWQALGKYGILCLEDIVHEVANAGPHFREILNFLGSFSLNKPKEGLQGKRALFKDGGDTGNRENQINDLIDKMN